MHFFAAAHLHHSKFRSCRLPFCQYPRFGAPLQLSYFCAMTPSISGSIALSGSKSISNRVLIIRALCDTPFEIQHLANAKDTTTLRALLDSNEPVLDAGAAGTTFRFLTAYLAMHGGTQILTGSARMKQRPIAGLVDALRALGATIDYLEMEGFPPLRIGPPSHSHIPQVLPVKAGASSQYVSALLLIAPTLPNGLTIKLDGPIVSRPYIEMTLSLMRQFGVTSAWVDAQIHIARQPYQGQSFRVEADWSAASYYYSMAAMAEEADLVLEGLFPQSVQGDACLAEMMQTFGVETQFEEKGIRILKRPGTNLPKVFEYDFLPCPDLAQTLAVTCAALGVTGLFTGLDTLAIKETDRITALSRELNKIGVQFMSLPNALSKKSNRKYYLLEGKAAFSGIPEFETYEDHRMAMAFAPLGVLSKVRVKEPGVVEKSYPNFWADLEKIGFKVRDGIISLA